MIDLYTIDITNFIIKKADIEQQIIIIHTLNFIKH